MITPDKIKAYLQVVPEVAAWPELIAVFDRTGNVPHPDWELPVLACQAVGGDEGMAVPVAGAIACMQISIMLLDDILDDDPRGEHLRRGYGATSNLALAFQAVAFRLVNQMPISHSQRAAITASLAHLALATALGQHWDGQNLAGEANYWKVVRAKSTPFYGAAYEIGALLGNAHPEIVQGLYELGTIIGEIIQIEDDLTDAFQNPANADWYQGRNNLLILYALTAEHPSQERFVTLREQIANPERLEEAQQILIASGAVSYCAFHLVTRYQAARRLLDSLNLYDPTPIQDTLENYADSLLAFLQLSGVKVSRELLLESQRVA